MPAHHHPHRLALLSFRQELREDHAEAHRRKRQPESGVRPGGHPHIRRRSGRRNCPHHRNRTTRQARHLPLQQRRRLLVVRLRQGNLRAEWQHLQHPALPQRRVPQQGETPPLLRPRQDQDQGHFRHRSTLLERLAEEVHQGAGSPQRGSKPCGKQRIKAINPRESAVRKT